MFCWCTLYAFNFRSGDGFCELLLELPEYYEPSDYAGVVFTQLRQPDFRPPMAKQSKPPDTSYLQWVACNSTTVPSSFNIKVSNDRYVALGFNRGMYLPAFWRTSEKLVKMFYPPDEKSVRCDHGYLLSIENPDQYEWAAFQIGNPIPVGSVSAGSHVDATPFYIVRIICKNIKRSRFYSASFRSIYVGCFHRTVLNDEIEILLLV